MCCSVRCHLFQRKTLISAPTDILIFTLSVIFHLQCRGIFPALNHFLFFFNTGLLVPVDEERLSHLILGVLLTLRYLMPLLQQQVNTISLKGSFGVMKKEADIQPTPEQLLQVNRGKKKTTLLQVFVSEKVKSFNPQCLLCL